MLKTKDSKIQNVDIQSYLFHQGTNFKAYEFLGAHFIDRKKGVVCFRTWAPKAESVSVVGDFNGWNEKSHVMQRITKDGVFEVFVEGVKQLDNYKFSIISNGKAFLKADPYAFYSELFGHASRIYDIEGYEWGDQEFVKNRKSPYDKPINIYEVNLASWKRKNDGGYLSYNELADQLVDYVCKMGYTHVEFMPVNEYPFDGSWGYQVTGYYSITSRFGSPKEFMCLIDKFHQKGISVVVDWVSAHFPKDTYGLFEFDGYPCYEKPEWDGQEFKTWGTRAFDLEKNEVQSFLISSAEFLFDKFHIDGLRVDAVSSMLYLDYERSKTEWVPNENGGNYNLASIRFLQKLNVEIFCRFPYALMIAEESTAYPLVTKPVNVGGLGFNYKWNMGWMNDTLSYMQCDPYFRAGNHNKMTFSMVYAFSENFILPLSHDEVVHCKKSLINKMPGELENKFSQLKTYLLFTFAHPGKKLNFMGNEFAQDSEWNYQEGLKFSLLKEKNNVKFRNFVIKLNFLYKENAPLYQVEDSWLGFEWLVVDEKDNNVLSFKRKDKSGKEIIFIGNFSGNDYENYRLGIDEGYYKILISTDDKKFGGNGIVQKKVYKTIKKRAHGRKDSILLRLPKFCGMYIEKKI